MNRIESVTFIQLREGEQVRPGRAAGVVRMAFAVVACPLALPLMRPMRLSTCPQLGARSGKARQHHAFKFARPSLWKLVPWAPREAVAELETRHWWACLPQLPVLPAPTRRRTVAKSSLKLHGSGVPCAWAVNAPMLAALRRTKERDEMWCAARLPSGGWWERRCLMKPPPPCQDGRPSFPAGIRASSRRCCRGR